MSKTLLALKLVTQGARALCCCNNSNFRARNSLNISPFTSPYPVNLYTLA